jgi:hypothetical protein
VDVLAWGEGATAAIAAGSVEVVVGRVVVVVLPMVVDVEPLVDVVFGAVDVVDAGGRVDVEAAVAEAALGGVVVVEGARDGALPSQLIARALPDPPATWGLREGVDDEGDPSPPNSTTAMT